MSRLDRLAQFYIRKAKEAEAVGRRDEALANYKNAAEVIQKLLDLYPDHPLKKAYLESLKNIKLKLNALQEEIMSEPVGKEEVVQEIETTTKPKVSFDDVVGLEDAKRAIEEAIVFPAKRPDLFPLGWPRGILLFGPPGCGKTLLAAAVANELDAEFIYVDAATIMSKWLGQAEKNVASLFNKAREVASSGKPVIIFIDEVDSLFGTYANEVGGETRMRNQFLKEMDGLQDKGSNLQVYVIGATNKPWKLDEAFVRRFEKRIYVPPPNEEARKRLLLKTLSKVKHEDVDVDTLAKLTEGYSSADIVALVRDAYMRVVRELFEKNGGVGEPRPVTMDDLLWALRRRKPSIKKETLKMYEEWFKAHGAL
ncbi:AAA family ATPase [Ignicoccus hospitalis]|uniref:AAA ATPase, central domain protein n=1 Tax=Ignicoccus hospitalis (strain KIN4/I / DSM 18386 / JCM 14125) TaxID=453591 RepID=A8AB71_IGNH4|nr:AAA family ATPase [Ignicoccus hospitalis]ABU82173.1 AAA ATPase, central domain protein [Ignicoccus hospitalis KIN4/I]HIH91130.1 AAA family ATPase [Desulfurococcaceae archaeon]